MLKPLLSNLFSFRKLTISIQHSTIGYRPVISCPLGQTLCYSTPCFGFTPRPPNRRTPISPAEKEQEKQCQHYPPETLDPILQLLHLDSYEVPDQAKQNVPKGCGHN